MLIKEQREKEHQNQKKNYIDARLRKGQPPVADRDEKDLGSDYGEDGTRPNKILEAMLNHPEIFKIKSIGQSLSRLKKESQQRGDTAKDDVLAKERIRRTFDYKNVGS